MEALYFYPVHFPPFKPEINKIFEVRTAYASFASIWKKNERKQGRNGLWKAEKRSSNTMETLKYDTFQGICDG